ncbi:MAG: hypothetical protein GXO36_00170 [Chloroflexi bacterium]|nr:hypothetical protein [Chloroflexota bacterium]
MPPRAEDFASLYAAFDEPVVDGDCGLKCAPHNAYGVPFCCDTRHAVPTMYGEEWAFVVRHSEMWRPWLGPTDAETRRLWDETPRGQLPVMCQGLAACARERGFRSIVCRAFPFFPYLSREGEFLGLTYYWPYEDRCWVISHLDRVRPAFREAFVRTYERLFALYPHERETFRYHSIQMRRVFGRRHREIPLLHRDGGYYWVRPRDGRLRPARPEDFPKHGIYAVLAELPFPDEESDNAASSVHEP